MITLLTFATLIVGFMFGFVAACFFLDRQERKELKQIPNPWRYHG